MSDNETTQIDMKFTGDTSGLENALNEVKSKLQEVDKETEKIINHFNALSQINFSNIPVAHKGKVSGFVDGKKYINEYDTQNTTASKDAHLLQTQINKQLRQKLKSEQVATDLARKQVDNYEKELRIQEKEASAMMTSANAYAKMANTADYKKDSVINYNNALAMKHKNLSGYYKYKGEHPEQFVSQRFNTRYQIGNTVSQIGNMMTNTGVVGRIAGDTISSIGSFIMNPALGLFTVITKLVSGIKDLSKAMSEAYGKIQMVKTNLEVVYGSRAEANSAFGEISQYAVKSPFGVEQTSELAILLKQSGVYATDLMDTLKMIGDTSGGNMEKMKRIANNYAQIVSIGKASMLDMRQFAYTGIPIFEAVSKELGVTQSQLRKMISDGEVTSDIIEKVFKDLTGINGIFEDATSKGAKTYQARLQNLQDSQQLLLSSMGENFIENLGAKAGGESYVYKALSLTEDVYKGLNEWIDGKNLEHDIKEIKQNKNNIEIYKSLIEYNKSIGRDEYVKLFEQAIKAEQSKITRDMETATFYNSYLSKTQDYEKYLAQGYTMDILELRKQINDNFELEQKGYLEIEDIDSASAYVKVLREQREILREVIKSVEKYNDITTDELNASYIMKTKQAQNEAYTTVDKKAKGTGSALSVTADIEEAIKKTEEEQKKAEEKRLKLWQETIDLMTEMKGILNENDVVDMSKLSFEDFVKYQSQGALQVNRKLNTDVIDNKSIMADDRKIIESQFDSINNNLSKILNSPEFSNMYGYLARNKSNYTDEQYLKQFNRVFNSQRTLLEQMLEEARRNNQKDRIKQLEDALLYYKSATNILESNSSIAGYDLSKLNIEKTTTSATDVTYALWKRILSQYTGLSANTIYSTKNTIDAFANDVSVRKMASSIMKTMLENGSSVFNVQALLKTSGISKKLVGDTGKVYQYDMAKTKKSLEEFALKLSVSSDIIDVYNQKLEEEKNAYIGLLSEGIMTTESDNTASRVVSSKTAEKYLKDFDSQLVNAFGEQLTTVSGKKVSYNESKQAFVDEKGNEIAEEQLVITGNIWTVVEKYLKDVNKKLEEANKIAVNNRVGDNLISALSGVILDKIFLNTNSSYLYSRFDDKNKEVFKKALLENLKNSNLITNGTYSNVNELMYGYAKGNSDAVIEIQVFANRLLDASEGLSDFRYLLDEINKQRNFEATSSFSNELFSSVSNEKKFLTPKEYINNKKNDYYNNLLSKFGYDGASIDEAVILTNNRMSSVRNKVSELMGSSSIGESQIKDLGNLGIDNEYLSRLKEANSDLEKQRDILGEISLAYQDIDAEQAKTYLSNKNLTDIMKEFASSVKDTMVQFAQKSFTNIFETMGENIGDASNYTKDLAKNMKSLTAETLKSLGADMAKAGFAIAANGAYTNNKTQIIAGLALAAAGGFASGMGGFLSSSNDNNEEDDKYDKLQSITDQIKELLAQARVDSIYYENEMRHKEALGKNRSFSYKSVNDALISSNGNIITTNPKDYLIATTNPRELVNNRSVVQPSVSFKIENYAGVKVTPRETVKTDGSVEVIAKIEELMTDFISSSKSDDAFNARDMRIRGNYSVR